MTLLKCHWMSFEGSNKAHFLSKLNKQRKRKLVSQITYSNIQVFQKWAFIALGLT